MHGNVWEWCFDAYDALVYRSRSNGELNPVVTESPENHRVLRGGSLNHVPAGLRSASRTGFEPDLLGGYIGFRVLKTP
jgi:formylglycine-generating enzyme required for sulfatase activity